MAQQRDENKDWAQDQLIRLGLEFDKADTDGSGCLTLSELDNALQKAGFIGNHIGTGMMFNFLNKDGDNKITRAEFDQAIKDMPLLSQQEMYIRKTFKDMDRDGNGVITEQEIDKYRLLFDDLSREDIEDLKTARRRDYDGKLTVDEFVKAFSVKKSAAVMERVFKTMDKDGNKSLCKQEIIDGVFMNRELRVFQSELAAVLKAFGKDEDQKIDYNEFIKAWKKQ